MAFKKRRDREEGGSGFKYRKLGADAYRKRQTQSGGNRTPMFKTNVPQFQVSENRNTIRLLPATWEDAEHYGVDIYVHYSVGANNDSVLCPAEHKQGKCPICEERARAVKKGDEDYSYELRAVKRVLVYLVDRKKEGEGIKLWAMPYRIDKEITTLAVDEGNGEIYRPDDPNNGYDVEFRVQGSGKKREYLGVSIARKASELDNDKALAEAEKHPLPDILSFLEYDEIAELFSGTGEEAEEDSDDDDDDSDTKRSDRDRGARGARRPAADDDGDDDDEDTDGVDDDDDDEDSDDDADEDDADSDLSWEDLKGMSLKELKQHAKEADVELDEEPDDDVQHKKLLRRKLAKELGIEIPAVGNKLRRMRRESN